MSGIVQAMRWRARLACSVEMWRTILRERGKPRSTACLSPTVRILEEDESADQHLLEIDGHGYWLPRSMGWSGLRSTYEEVFSEGNPHYYEHAGCRIQPGDVVLDAGASEGFFTRFALQRGARVLVVEPVRSLAAALRRTFAAEIAAGRVCVTQAALSDSVGEVRMKIDAAWPWGVRDPEAGVESAPHPPRKRGAESTGSCEVVPQSTVDALVEGCGWGRCDFVKMDVEGDERGAVRGSVRTMKRCRPCLAIAVYHLPTGYLDIRSDLRNLRREGLDYAVAAKGLQSLKGFRIPMILHAWPSERG